MVRIQQVHLQSHQQQVLGHRMVHQWVQDQQVLVHQQVVLGLGDCDDSVCTSVPLDLDVLSVCGDEVDMRPQPVPAKRSSKSLVATGGNGCREEPEDFPVHKAQLLPQYASCTGAVGENRLICTIKGQGAR